MTIEKLKPITQLPIVRPEYTDPRGEEFYSWQCANADALSKYQHSLNLWGDDDINFSQFCLIQYETEMIRREMEP